MGHLDCTQGDCFINSIEVYVFVFFDGDAPVAFPDSCEGEDDDGAVRGERESASVFLSCSKVLMTNLSNCSSVNVQGT